MTGLKGPLSCLSEARFGIVFGVVGAARDCLETAIDYAINREQFDKPIAGFQLTQKKLADMTVELDKAFLLALHLGRLKDAGTIKPEHGLGRQAQQRPGGHRPSLASRARSSAPTGSRWSTRCCATPTISSRC